MPPGTKFSYASYVCAGMYLYLEKVVECDAVQIGVLSRSFAEKPMQNPVDSVDTAALVQGAKYMEELVQGILAGKEQYYPGVSAINPDLDTLQEIIDGFNKLSGLIGVMIMEYYWQQNFGERLNFKLIRPKLPDDAQMN